MNLIEVVRLIFGKKRCKINKIIFLIVVSLSISIKKNFVLQSKLFFIEKKNVFLEIIIENQKR